MAEKQTEVFVLPASKKRIKVPAGLKEEQLYNGLFQLLQKDKFKGKEYDEDRKLIGDKLETSGWGAAIGGTIGSIGGGFAGLFAGPGAIAAVPAGSIAGGAGGAAIGEGIEQWITGKGDTSDIGDEAIAGGLWGVIPGAAGAGARVAKLAAPAAVRGAQPIGAISGAGAAGGAIGEITGGDPTASAVGGAVGFVAGGALGAKITNKFSQAISTGTRQFAGREGASAPQLFDEGLNKVVSGAMMKARGVPLGGAQMGAGQADIKRAGVRAAMDYIGSVFGAKSGGRATEAAVARNLTPEELVEVRRAVEAFVSKKADKMFAEKAAIVAGGTAGGAGNVVTQNRGGLLGRSY